jgi:carbon storage regulator CsrA
MALIIGRTPQARADNPLGQVWIGDDVCISLLRHQGGVRLHIEAPKNVKVLRGEIKAGIEKEEPNK